MRIEIRLTENCNYDCTYCTDMHDNTKDRIDVDYIGLNNVLEQFDNPEVFIYGGEPTLHPELIPLVKHLNSFTDNIIIQTNGSNPNIIKQCSAKINYSYHIDHTLLHDFVKVIDRAKVNEIAYMDHERADYNDYKKLKTIYGKVVQFCPVINSTVGEPPSTERLKNLIFQPIFKELNQVDEHFISTDKERSSNWFIWAMDEKSINKECSVQHNMLHIQNNKVYFCFNAMMRDESGTSTSEYKHNPVNIKCPYNYCYFGMENQI